MTGSVEATPVSEQIVGVLAWEGALAIAIVAALAYQGWSCRPWPPPSAPRDPSVAVLVIAGESGELPPLPRPSPAHGARHPPLIGVGGAAAMPRFAALPTAPPAALLAVADADLPFPVVVEALDAVLSGRREPPPAAGLAEALARRADERRRCATLSRREAFVLAEILDGRSAAEVAAAEHVALPTIRSQVRGVLTKLEVPSQLAAATVATRSWDERPRSAFVH